MSASQQMLKDVRQSFEQIIQKYPQIKGNLNKCYKEIEDIITHTQATKEAKKIEKKEKIKTMLKKFNDKTFLDKSYEGLVHEVAANEDKLIEVINKLSKAMTDLEGDNTVDPCCGKEDVKNKDGTYVCSNCGLVQGYEIVDELGQIKFAKMFKPVTSRLDTQIEATKKLENKGLKDGDVDQEGDDYPLPEYPIDEAQTEDGDEDEMPDYEPPIPIDEAQTEDEDEMPDYEPPLPIDEDEIADFEAPLNREEEKRMGT
ncbi:hypothetical protein ACROYT_G027184 [Oculina patagonica]